MFIYMKQLQPLNTEMTSADVKWCAVRNRSSDNYRYNFPIKNLRVHVKIVIRRLREFSVQ